MPGVRAAAGTQIAFKGKVGREAAASFKVSGVKFSEDSKGSFEATQFLREASRARLDKPSLMNKAIVEVGEALIPGCDGRDVKGKCEVK